MTPLLRHHDKCCVLSDRPHIEISPRPGRMDFGRSSYFAWHMTLSIKAKRWPYTKAGGITLIVCILQTIKTGLI